MLECTQPRRLPGWLVVLLIAACSATDEDAGPLGSNAPNGPSATDLDRDATASGPLPASPDGGLVESSTSLPPDASTPHAGKVPIFVAQGKLGRTTVSCDDGRTWIADHSEVPTGRCWDAASPNNIECDHHSWSSLGMVDANGAFLATYGWGYPGVVRRSEDGIHWTDVLPGHTFAGLAFGNGRVLANDRKPWISSTNGTQGSWAVGGEADSPVWNVRSIGFVPKGGGRFIITFESGTERDIRLSDDNGSTWQPVKTRPSECAASVMGILHGNDVTLLVQRDGTVCRSLDRGDTWTLHKVADAFTSTPLFSDGSFLVWNGSTRWASSEGATWTNMPGTPNVNIGPVARSTDGSFAAVRGGWDTSYDKQQFYRSTDGINWTTLPTTSFAQGHPITHLMFGWATPSTECPLK